MEGILIHHTCLSPRAPVAATVSCSCLLSPGEVQVSPAETAQGFAGCGVIGNHPSLRISGWRVQVMRTPAGLVHTQLATPTPKPCHSL